MTGLCCLILVFSRFFDLVVFAEIFPVPKTSTRGSATSSGLCSTALTCRTDVGTFVVPLCMKCENYAFMAIAGYNSVSSSHNGLFYGSYVTVGWSRGFTFESY